MAFCWSPIVTTASARNWGQHVRADFFDFLVRIVAERVRPCKTGSDFGEIPGFEQRQHPHDLFIQIAAEVVVHGLDAIVDPAEPGIVGRGGEIIDDRIDQGPRGLRFLMDLQPFRLVDRLAFSKAWNVRRRLHLGDHHPAKRQRLLQRADIHPRQMSVGFNVFGCQFVELMSNSSRHHRRQNRRNGHQDDQSQCDAEDSVSDRRPQHQPAL
jgi:hypothetical protein